MSKRNLLDETRARISGTGHSEADIEFIGSEDGQYGMTWEQFQTLANRYYDSGFGGQEVASDLIVLFRDGSLLQRDEYDGSEAWELHVPPVPNPNPKPITTLFPEGYGATIAESEKEEQNG